MRLHRAILAASATASLGAAACEPSGVPLPPRVQFHVTDTVGPCSSDVGIRFTLDGAFLADEGFTLNLPPNRRLSSEFFVSAGMHTIGAQVSRFGNQVITDGFSWPDTTVTLVPNQLFVRTIDFYCS